MTNYCICSCSVDVHCGITFSDLTSSDLTSSLKSKAIALRALCTSKNSALFLQTLASLLQCEENYIGRTNNMSDVMQLLQETPDMDIAVLLQVLFQCGMYEVVGKVGEWHHGGCLVCGPIYQKALEQLSDS